MKTAYLIDRVVIRTTKHISDHLVQWGVMKLFQWLLICVLGVTLAVSLRARFLQGEWMVALQVPCLLFWMAFAYILTMMLIMVHFWLDPAGAKSEIREYGPGYFAWALVILLVMYISGGLLLRETKLGYPLFFHGVAIVLPSTYLIFVLRRENTKHNTKKRRLSLLEESIDYYKKEYRPNR